MKFNQIKKIMIKLILLKFLLILSLYNKKLYAETTYSSLIQIPKVYTSMINYQYHLSYSNSECTLSGLENPKINLEYSIKSENNSDYKVAWKIRSEQEIPSYQKIAVGSEITIQRCLPPGYWSLIANGLVTNLNGTLVEAIVTVKNKLVSSYGKINDYEIENKNLFLRPMVGDNVIPLNKTISKKVTINENFLLAVENLFEKDNKNNFSYELSENGEKIIQEKMEKLKNMNGKILIEGFNLNIGNTKEIRIETLIRAQTIAKFIINYYQIDEKKVFAIGYGNDWLKTGMNKNSNGVYSEITNGIIIRKLPE